ncbi:FadR/GntR family transcriptional regulator [uncultured Oscillibacter sp.]|uniref:FadR/GntR family transcriptional regulator n=1 Tax=uncultured Oscillibacter sp. TaxID=876091 RepID=UPI0025D6422C|nr:FadR/GntR family transcriptional regulator [uncultured Oscillibacter sp.]
MSNKYMGIVEIQKINIGEQVYHQLKNQILSREWKPGEKIPSENQLMGLFGVSRGTVRQAVQKLAGEGLIATRHGEGSFVQTTGLDHYFQTTVPLFTIGEEEMAKIFEFREMFESGVAEVAALKATEEQICRLEENYERMKQEVEVLDQYVHTDLEFHMLISECTQNTLAVQIFHSYEGLLGPSILDMTATIGSGNGVKYHGLILDAVRRHDAPQARAVMQKHLEDNMERFKRMRLLSEKRES